MKRIPAWTKKARLKVARQRVCLVYASRGASVQRDPQLVFIALSLRRGNESASRQALERYLMVAQDLEPQQRLLLAEARDDLGPPWMQLRVIGIAVRIVIGVASVIRWLISSGPIHFQEPVHAGSTC